MCSHIIHDDLIRSVAETLDKDENRLKFSWDNFNIRLKDYYSEDEDNDETRDKFKVTKIVIDLCASDIKDEHKIYENINILNLYNKFTTNNEQMRNTFQKLFDNNRTITTLTIEDYDDYGVLEYAKSAHNLKSVISSCEIIRYNDFSQFKNLEKLILVRYNGSIDSLKRLTKLKYLCLDGYMGSIDALKDLKNIRYLTISEFDGDFDLLDELENLIYLKIKKLNTTNNSSKKIGLKYLDVYEVSKDVLKRLTELRYLKLNSTKTIELEELKYLSKLDHLYVDDWDTIDMSKLPYLESLKTLRVTCVRLKDFSFIGLNKNLTRLEIDQVEPLQSDADISFVSELKNLKILELGRDYDRDIEFVRGLTELKVLKIVGMCFNESLDPLKDLDNLEHLDIEKTVFNRSIDVLSDLKKLKILKLGNPIDL